MKKLISHLMAMLFFIIMSFIMTGCKKSTTELNSLSDQQMVTSNGTAVLHAPTPASPNFNLEVILRGDGNSFGLVKFRQNNDISKIVTLDTWIRDMLPDHEYKLQRAVDTNIDGNCTSTAWLTLGKGLQAESIFTDANGVGRADLFRNLSAAPSGATFDIHFRVIDAVTSNVVLTSDCYQFTVR